MALTVDKLINDDRFSGENAIQFVLYMPVGILLLFVRIVLALVLWIASIILPNNQAVRQMLSTLACWTFGVYVKLKGSRDPRCSVMVANCVSCLDALAASHVLGTISLKKWKVPPFFASTMGIRNAAQFVRKQHFGECASQPVLLQPEGGAANGRGVLRFTDWPCPLGNRVQPLAITVERPFTNVTVHRATDARDKFPWSDAWWFLWTPATVFSITLLPALERHDDDDAAFAARIRQTIADGLGTLVVCMFPWSDAWWFLWTPATVFSITLLPALERHDDDDAAFAARIRQTIADGLGTLVVCKFPWSDAWWFLWTPATVFSITLLPALERHDDDDAAFAARIRQAIADGLGVELAEYKWEELNAGGRAPRRREPPPELARLARQVKEVLPAVPMRDIMRDLATTRSVDVTITNFLEGVSPYTPEATPGPSAPRYVTPAPTGVFSTNARDRQLSFQERKANMIAEARRKYIEKHGLDAALC
ncbi:uncharacterized protein LOC135077270 [Ostrinia nubilalis]|uniref:uncharacterized protein LOC135077270 n=1 Tax=Ostrinia nubilalis TaxID=29057 RepID=UPI00308264C4